MEPKWNVKEIGTDPEKVDNTSINGTKVECKEEKERRQIFRSNEY